MPVAAATRLVLRGETALIGVVVALVVAGWTLAGLGPPTPVMPEAAWVRLNEGVVRTAVWAVMTAAALSGAALLLPRRPWVVPIGLVLAWTIATSRAVLAHDAALGAIARVIRDHGAG